METNNGYNWNCYFYVNTATPTERSLWWSYIRFICFDFVYICTKTTFLLVSIFPLTTFTSPTTPLKAGINENVRIKYDACITCWSSRHTINTNLYERHHHYRHRHLQSSSSNHEMRMNHHRRSLTPMILKVMKGL